MCKKIQRWSTVSIFLFCIGFFGITHSAVALEKSSGTLKLTVPRSLTSIHWDMRIGKVTDYRIVGGLGFVTFDNGKIGTLKAQGIFANKDNALIIFGLLSDALSSEIFDNDGRITPYFAESLIKQVDPDLVGMDKLEMMNTLESAMGFMNTEMIEVSIDMPSPNEIMSQAAVGLDGGWTEESSYEGDYQNYTGYKAGEPTSGDTYETNTTTGETRKTGDKDTNNDGKKDKDSDGDGKTDNEEKKNGTDPNDKDSKIIWGKERFGDMVEELITDMFIQNMIEMYAHDGVPREELVLTIQTLMRGYVYRNYH